MLWPLLRDSDNKDPSTLEGVKPEQPKLSLNLKLSPKVHTPTPKYRPLVQGVGFRVC